jgi:multiple sugar transport system substrate-binding protein
VLFEEKSIQEQRIMNKKTMTRRDFLRAAAGTSAAILAAGSGIALAQDAPTPTPLPLPEGSAGKLTVIHRTEYFEEAQTLFRETVTQFAAEKGVELDISTANPESFGDFLGRLQAAVAAGNPPDIAYTSNISIAQMHLLGLLEDVTDVVDEAISSYGQIMPGTNAPKVGQFDGTWEAIPFLANTTGYFVRGDKLAEIGVDPASDLETYDQRRDAALAMSDPDNDFWGWGVTPNQSGDGHGFLMSVINSFGGHYTDETGQIVQFDSPETLAAVEWLTELYTSEKYAPALPPGILSWTDISNNEAYLASTIGYTHNAFSVYAAAKRNDPELFANTVILLAPLGPANISQRGGGIGGWLTISKGAPNTELAKELALNLLDPVNFTPMSAVAGGLFMPAYENLWTDELLAVDPNFAIIKEQVSVEDPFIGSSWPANPNAAIDAIRAAAIPEQMIANITSGRMSPADAVKDAQQKIVDIFEEGGIIQP